MNGDALRVLIVDDEKPHAEAVAESLERVGYECVLATSGSAGARKIEDEDFDVILTDLRMERLDGLAILRKAKQSAPDAEVVVITGHGDVKTAVQAIQQGAANYLTKPVDLAELRAIVDKAAERLRLARANRELKRQLDENLLEDELFGHEAGSYTGADRMRKGRFEHAHGGTLFLDEVGDMPATLQAKLLRVLEDKEVFRIGSNEPIKVNVRLLSATNHDLEAACAAGKFRQDLYFRLKVV